MLLWLLPWLWLFFFFFFFFFVFFFFLLRLPLLLLFFFLFLFTVGCYNMMTDGVAGSFLIPPQRRMLLGSEAELSI